MGHSLARAITQAKQVSLRTAHTVIRAEAGVSYPTRDTARQPDVQEGRSTDVPYEPRHLALSGSIVLPSTEARAQPWVIVLPGP